MTNDWQKVKDIFDSALEYASDDRAVYLDHACKDDTSLRNEVEKLLADYKSDFLEQPVMPRETVSCRLAIGENVGRYRIVRLLGSGGMGEVYLAKDGQLDRNVAIKFLNEKYESSESNLQRFIREAKAASALNHPNILTIHEIGETGGSHYIVSEFVDGKTLRELLNERKLKLSEVLDIAVQIAGALSAAHSARIVHRDIKPENVIVRSDGYIKVLDFGLAKLLPQQPSFVGLEDETIRQNHTAKGLILGTVSYMSPEQAKGEPADGRTDIFSLGIVIYEMLTGRTPFAGDSRSDTFANLINKEPRPLSEFESGSPNELDRIVFKMLRKTPDERYQTMKGLLADLRDLKEQISIESKHDRVSVSESEKITAVMPATTGGVVKITTESSPQAPRFRRRFMFAALPALLIALVFALAWYWRASPTGSELQIKSLAVLPLKSIEGSDNSLGLGIADSIIRRLSSTGTVIVRPTSAVRKYMNEDTDAITAAGQLKADGVLEGSFQRSGERLRVTVNLLRTSDGASIWNDKFEMNMSDIFAMQDTISQKVADRLKLRLDPSQQALLARKYTSNSIAYEYFVKGNFESDQATTSIGDMRRMETAIAYFKKAVETDPNYALAYTKLGAVYMRIANFNDPTNPVWVEKAKDAWARAESIDPDLAELYDARFEYYYSKYGKWDISRAIRETRTAMRSNPSVGNNSWGLFYDHLGLDKTAGIEELKRALEVDPTSVSNQARLAESYRLFGDCDKANEVSLQYFGEPYASALVCKGDVDQAIPLLETIVKKDPGDIVNRSFLALAYAKKGDRQAAGSLIPALIKDSPENRAYHHVTYNIAAVYALAGDSNEAVKWLRVTANTGMPNYTAFMRDPDFGRIRQTPEFQNLLAEVKPTWERYRDEIEGK